VGLASCEPLVEGFCLIELCHVHDFVEGVGDGATPVGRGKAGVGVSHHN
jgi:hypothetical protein